METEPEKEEKEVSGGLALLSLPYPTVRAGDDIFSFPGSRRDAHSTESMTTL